MSMKEEKEDDESEGLVGGVGEGEQGRKDPLRR